MGIVSGMGNTNNVADFIKYQRKKLNLTQEELSEKAGVGLRFIRDMEQVKSSLRMDKENQVLELLDYKLLPEKGMDPYEILSNYFNKNVKVSLKNKSSLVGFIIESHWEHDEIRSWSFIPNNNAIEYQQTQHKDLIVDLRQENIEKIALVMYTKRS